MACTSKVLPPPPSMCKKVPISTVASPDEVETLCTFLERLLPCASYVNDVKRVFAVF